MDLLVYSTLASEASSRLITVIGNTAQGENTEIFNNADSLILRLASIKKDQAVVILLITSQEDLAAMLLLHEFLKGPRLILILPDRQRQTVSKGHKFYPRFISYADSDFSDVRAVLSKITQSQVIGPENMKDQKDVYIHCPDKDKGWPAIS